ncbi:hypothetical protein HK102_007679, partial [Quaeritorhiza haematococci]
LKAQANKMVSERKVETVLDVPVPPNEEVIQLRSKNKQAEGQLKKMKAAVEQYRAEIAEWEARHGKIVETLEKREKDLARQALEIIRLQKAVKLQSQSQSQQQQQKANEKANEKEKEKGEGKEGKEAVVDMDAVKKSWDAQRRLQRKLDELRKRLADKTQESTDSQKQITTLRETLLRTERDRVRLHQKVANLTMQLNIINTSAIPPATALNPTGGGGANGASNNNNLLCAVCGTKVGDGGGKGKGDLPSSPADTVTTEDLMEEVAEVKRRKGEEVEVLRRRVFELEGEVERVRKEAAMDGENARLKEMVAGLEAKVRICEEWMKESQAGMTTAAASISTFSSSSQTGGVAGVARVAGVSGSLKDIRPLQTPNMHLPKGERFLRVAEVMESRVRQLLEKTVVLEKEKVKLQDEVRVARWEREEAVGGVGRLRRRVEELESYVQMMREEMEKRVLQVERSEQGKEKRDEKRRPRWAETDRVPDFAIEEFGQGGGGEGQEDQQDQQGGSGDGEKEYTTLMPGLVVPIPRSELWKCLRNAQQQQQQQQGQGGSRMRSRSSSPAGRGGKSQQQGASSSSGGGMGAMGVGVGVMTGLQQDLSDKISEVILSRNSRLSVRELICVIEHLSKLVVKLKGEVVAARKGGSRRW